MTGIQRTFHAHVWLMLCSAQWIEELLLLITMHGAHLEEMAHTISRAKMLLVTSLSCFCNAQLLA